jgi:hypothetical protein
MLLLSGMANVVHIAYGSTIFVTNGLLTPAC